MHQRKKTNRWHDGMSAHSASTRAQALIHSLVTTTSAAAAAGVQDLVPAVAGGNINGGTA